MSIKAHKFSFIEFTSEDIRELSSLFHRMGFTIVSEIYQNSKNNYDGRLISFMQGEIEFIVTSLGEFEGNFAKQHGPSVCSFGFKVDDPIEAHAQALELGATDFSSNDHSLALRGVGDSKLYLNNRERPSTNHRYGLVSIDHITHNVTKGNMNQWADFYEKLFEFKELHFFNIQGQKTSLQSRAMGNGNIAIPINESSDDKSQIQEYLDEYNGEGIQHIALSTDDIYRTVEGLRDAGIEFLDVPDTYYDAVNERVPGHRENLQRLQENKILIDGNAHTDEGILLQIFTKNCIGPVFFEVIQRKGNNGFGEGNFQALFEAIERDQIKRGVL